MILDIKTPIWTGDIDSKSNSLKSTGIMGSIRWWVEAILRGMYNFACDPIDDNPQSLTKRCPTTKENNREISQYCSACLIFGATGMRKLFRLHIEGGHEIFNDRPIKIMPKGRTGGWYLGSGLGGEINLDIISLDKDFDKSLISVPLTITAKLGAIGARTQNGYGIVELKEFPEIKIEDFKNSVGKITDTTRLAKLKIDVRKEVRQENCISLPNIKEMFFAKIQFEADNDWWKEVDGIEERGQTGDRDYYEGCANDARMHKWIDSGSVPIVPAIKNWLRYGYGKSLWQTGDRNKDRIIDKWLFGTIRNDKTASKVIISCAYLVSNNIWEFRIWGWIPENSLPDEFDRENFLDSLNKSLDGKGSAKLPWKNIFGNGTKEHRLSVWREYNSSRDTVKSGEEGIDNYLGSLLSGGRKFNES
ncbi:MAG: type III-B CRISPR module RAMP protein Cmr1 [Candidatus Freyarchaeum deiterrae]